MTAPRDPLRRAYHRSLALRWLATVLPMPALVPLLMARGLDVPQVGLVLAMYAAVTAALEVPTGGLADAVGRVRVTVVADALALVARLGMLLAPSFPAFLATAALAGVARALGSGALEAWYVDALRRRDPAADLRPILAGAGVVAALALGSGTLVGGAIPLVAPHVGLGPAGGVAALQLAFGVSLAVGVVALLATVALRDDAAGPLAGRAAARPDRVAMQAWRALRRDGSLTGLVLLGATGGATIMAFEAFFPVELAARWGDAAVTPLLGVALGGAFAATAAGEWIGGRLRSGDRKPLRLATLGHVLVAAAAMALAAVGSLGTVGAPSAALAVVGLWLAYLGMGAAAPSLASAFHGRAPSAQRAALLSVRSLAAYAGGVAAMVGFGVLGGAAGLSTVWLASAAVAALAAIGYASWRPLTPPDERIAPA
jgi:MFS family permease